MKQVIQSYRSGEMWLAEVPAPALRPGSVVVQTAISVVSAGTERMVVELAKKSLLGKAKARPDLVKQVLKKLKTEGISQTVTKVKSKLDNPIPLGYSCAGFVVEVGAGVRGLQVGQRVACAGAGYANHAEYNVVPQNLVVPIPEGVSFADASFATVGSIALQGVRQAEVRLGERVVVIGLGLLGLLTVQLLQASGCVVLGADLDPERRALARKLGAQTAEGDLIEAALAFTQGRGADATLITAATPSNQPIESAAEITRGKGRVVVVGLVGMDVPRDPFYKKELDLRLSMSYGPGRYDPAYEEGGHDYPFNHVRWTEQRNMQAFVEMVQLGRVTPGELVSHSFQFGDALDAYRLLEGKSESGKPEKYLGILLKYDASEPKPPARRLQLGSSAGSGDVHIGLIGAGNFMKSVLLPTLDKSGAASLRGICTATGMSASSTGKKHGFNYATTDHNELLRDPDINTVFIATQHDTHASLSLQALEANKHVFVEKPLCLTQAELDQLREHLTARQGGPLLMVGYNRRFSSHARAISRAFAQRSTPMAVTYRINAGVIPTDVWIQDPEVGGGRVLGECCHFVDLCEYLVGAAATRVYASCVETGDARHVAQDTVVMTINYADGSIATIQYFAHGSSDLPKERVEVHAAGMSAVLDDYRETTFHGARANNIRGSQDKGFIHEVTAFVTCVRDGGARPIEADSLLRTSQVTLSALESLKTGRPVLLPEESR